jgi:CheY-like chemotaxis protein
MTVIDGEEVVLSLWEDISEAKKLQQELKIAKHAAEQASQAKSDFLANMSHEIRTPMTGLLGFIEALQKTEDDPQKIKQFKIVQNSGNTLLNIINDILDFSKIESGKMELDCTPIPLLENLYNSIENFSTLADSKNINLLSAIDENVPECIMGDITRIKQVLFNLISNAIKFTNESGTITLKAYFEAENNLLHIEVLDTGIGISQHNLQKIFESFSQEDISTTRKFGGTGLGISISAKLVQLMGGTLEVNSKVGEGSRFYFEIPIKICDKQDLAHIESETDIGTHIQTLRGDILIVEDNKTNQMLMGMILDDLELSYDIANNGEEALTLVNQKRYDLIFMDENMPIMNGIEATKIIRANESEANLHTPIIAVTANALIEDREKFLKAGMDDYISKPYTQDQIIATLQKFLDKKTEV